MAEVLGCGVADLPFTYLGVPVGCNMSRVTAWHSVVEKFKSTLSHWKARTFSVGGRLLLLKAVLGNLPTYYLSIYKIPVTVEKSLEALRRNFFLGGDLDERKMSWVAWRKCLAKKELGGLGIGSIYALNRALLFKWVWRFQSQPHDLWAQVISHVHGVRGGLDGVAVGTGVSPWVGVLKSLKGLMVKGVDMSGCCKRKVGDGRNVLFWQERWLGATTLKDRFSRVYALEKEKECMVVNRVVRADWDSFLRRQPRGGQEEVEFLEMTEELRRVTLRHMQDGWVWEHNGDDGYTVASGRTLIDMKVLEVDSVATRWNRMVSAVESYGVG